MIDQLLSQLGLEPRQIAVLNTICLDSPLAAAEIAKRAGLPRSTAYLLLEQLEQRGLLISIDSQGTRVYQLCHPTKFLEFVNLERTELAKKERAAQSLVEILSTRDRPAVQFPRLRFVSGKREIEEFLNARLAAWRASGFGNIAWWGYQDDLFVEQYQRWLDRAWRTSLPEEKVCLFSNFSGQNAEASRKVRGRTIRAVPESFSFASTLWSVGEFVIMISTRHNPHYCFELHDEIFAENLRAIFQMLWHTDLVDAR